MTKFEPEVAYRILVEKQRRLYGRSGVLLGELSELEYTGKLNYWGRIWRNREITALEKEADGMWDVLDYLRTRIEEEKHDAV